MSKRERDSKGAEAGSSGRGADNSRAGLRAAAIQAAAHGDAEQQGRFRDAECFIPASRDGRHEEEGFSVHAGGADAMSGAVMDLMQDETVCALNCTNLEPCRSLAFTALWAAVTSVLEQAVVRKLTVGGQSMLAAQPSFGTYCRRAWQHSSGDSTGTSGDGSMCSCRATSMCRLGSANGQRAARWAAKRGTRGACTKDGSSPARCACLWLASSLMARRLTPATCRTGEQAWLGIHKSIPGVGSSKC